jgi:hypothetical protein
MAQLFDPNFIVDDPDVQVLLLNDPQNAATKREADRKFFSSTLKLQFQELDRNQAARHRVAENYKKRKLAQATKDEITNTKLDQAEEFSKAGDESLGEQETKYPHICNAIKTRGDRCESSRVCQPVHGVVDETDVNHQLIFCSQHRNMMRDQEFKQFQLTSINNAIKAYKLSLAPQQFIQLPQVQHAMAQPEQDSTVEDSIDAVVREGNELYARGMPKKSAKTPVAPKKPVQQPVAPKKPAVQPVQKPVVQSVKKPVPKKPVISPSISAPIPAPAPAPVIDAMDLDGPQKHFIDGESDAEDEGSWDDDDDVEEDEDDQESIPLTESAAITKQMMNIQM